MLNFPARAVWNRATSPKPGTLSVLSDDTFMSAIDGFFVSSFIKIYNHLFQPGIIPLDSASISVDQEASTFYREGLAQADSVKYRKSRAEVCGCESKKDFAAKLWCLRQAFDAIISDQSSRRWMIQTGRNIISGLLRRDDKDPREFYASYDQLMEYVENPNNHTQIEMELRDLKV